MAVIVHLIWAVLLFTTLVILFVYRRMARNANNVTKQTLEHLKHAQSTARAYLDAAKLIAIHRNERLNVFTFARQDNVFTIETFGVMSDDPDKWREQAGLM